MFGTMQRGVGAYAKVGLETGVAAASPHKLIVMLYDGAMVSILSGISNMKAGNIPAKGAAISKAINIIDNGLRAALDKKVGGEIAQNLDALYEYISARLLKANLSNDPAILEEAHALLSELREAWNAIDPQAAATGATAPAAPAPMRAPTLMSA
ncbi:flagellar export chaperone FliS [Massilia sp. LC238]|uniref:flagellar export chaperone FliS n=1 Tax=unclassified Massilia TaxID=2609279 RepID=UPI0004E35601|nr:flagellar export chaperone FliS [Massilia sp. LC238]KFC69108.1 Flagellar protein FliS [Massilia sp. LC238]